MDNLALACRCGTISGRAIKVYPHHGTRVVCYCKDCQAFAQALGGAETTLDAYGGTDIYQLPAARVHACGPRAAPLEPRLLVTILLHRLIWEGVGDARDK